MICDRTISNDHSEVFERKQVVRTIRSRIRKVVAFPRFMMGRAKTRSDVGEDSQDGCNDLDSDVR